MVIQELKPPGYSFTNISRDNDRHGGIGILYKSHMNLRLIKADSPSVTFESVHVVDESKGLHMFAIYSAYEKKVIHIQRPIVLSQFI